MKTTKEHQMTVILGEVTTDPRTGEQCRQIFEYERGECTDRYVTMVHTERMAKAGR
jgi:hypothetical protein